MAASPTSNPDLFTAKKLIVFILKVIIIYALLVVLIRLYLGIVLSTKIPESLKSLNEVYYFVRNMGLYEGIANSILFPAEFILSILGFETHLEGLSLRIASSRGILLHSPCMGLELMAAFISLMIAFPDQASLKRKAAFIFFGLLIIHLMNILRVTGLVLKNHYQYSLPIDQHDLFNFIVYCFVLLAFYCWVNYFSAKPQFRSNTGSVNVR